jgi:pyruvate/2-oxoglutarate/acetoin dehydrogenase E1 component
MSGDVPEEMYRIPLSKANVIKEGTDVTIVGMSLMTIEAIHACEYLKKYGISCEVIDLRTISPIDWDTIYSSLNKTGRIIALDNGHGNVSVASEVIARVTSKMWNKIKAAPIKLAMPDFPESTSPALTKNYHVRAEHIVLSVAEMFGKNIDVNPIIMERNAPHDVPGNWFTGPF